jgi:hypothetical protein
MSRLRPKYQESEVLLAFLRCKDEQRPGSEAKARRQLLGVRHTYRSAKQVLPPTQTKPSARSLKTDS